MTDGFTYGGPGGGTYGEDDGATWSTDPEITHSMDWEWWIDETVEALVATIERAGIDWGKNPETEEPYIVVGDTTSAGIQYPAAFIPEFTLNRDSADSNTTEDSIEINSRVWIVRKGNRKSQEANLRESLRLAGRVTNALYGNRNLFRTCNRVDVDQITPAAAVVDGETLQTVDMQITINKDAHHR